MSHISTLRSLCHSSFLCANPIVERSLLFSSLLPKQRALLSCQSSPVPVFGCTGGRGRGQPGAGGSGGFQRRRGSSTLREKSKESAPLRVPEMEEKEAVAGYNKRRAEGRDKRDTTRTMQLKTRKLNPVNTTCYVQILGTGMDTQDTSPSVFLFFDKQRFIFNAGEGLQRFCTEHKIKLSKVDHLFLTRVSSETAGGLPGLLLTLAGIGEEGMSVNIWGPSDLDFLVNAMKSFIPNAAMVHTHSFGETQNGNGGLGSSMYPIALIDDEVVRLSAISLKPNSSAASLMKPGDIAVVYICELPEIKGKFDPEKAAACGLKPGPKYRELQLGNSVMSDSLNIMVHPCDVLGPSVPGPIVLLVDCPTASHMAELFDAKSLNCYYVDVPDCQREHSKLVNCMIHLGPAAVTKTLDYQNWMKRFGRTQHIMAGHEMKNMAIPILKSSARIASRLNYLSPQLFPAPEFWSQKDCSSAVSCEIPTSNCVDIVAAENLLKFHLRPYSHLGLDKSSIPTSLDREHIVKELLSEIPEVEDVCRSISQFWKDLKPMKNVKKYVMEEPWFESSYLPNDKHWNEDLNEVSDAPACLNNVSREDMEIVLLGTGSSQPSKYRNVSSIFINLFSKGSLLLDCGEGTLAQLKRRFGVEGADEAVRSLKCIWVSHIHADHHTGLARILALRCQLLKDVPHEPLLVIGPLPLKRFLDAYSRLEDLDMLFLDCRHTIEPFLETIAGREALDGKETNLFARGGGMQSYWMKPGSPVGTDASRAVSRRLKEVLLEAGLESLNSVPVVHCPQAFAIVLKAAERTNRVGRVVPGWKVVYSGDTRPCQSLIDASRDATVLIHEATFEDGLGEEAVSRNHSTTSEAIRVGSAAGAYRVILTHFSQRYPKIPVFDEIHMHNTCIAFDLMSVNLVDLPLLPKVLPYLKVLFKNDANDANVDEPEDAVDLAVIQY